MNVPRSLERLLEEYQARGYQVELRNEQQLIDELSALLAPFCRKGALADLLAKDRAGRLSLEDYSHWFEALPQQLQQAINERWGSPQQAGLLISEGQQQFFAIPRLQLGKKIACHSHRVASMKKISSAPCITTLKYPLRTAIWPHFSGCVSRLVWMRGSELWYSRHLRVAAR